MKNLRAFLMARLRERGTWAHIATLIAGLCGVVWEPAYADHIGGLMIGLMVAIGVLTPEAPTKAPPK